MASPKSIIKVLCSSHEVAAITATYNLMSSQLYSSSPMVTDISVKLRYNDSQNQSDSHIDPEIRGEVPSLLEMGSEVEQRLMVVYHSLTSTNERKPRSRAPPKAKA
ncbi:hypothetical protein Fot_28879 [Forsythia ovata]|uniref:Uncharacterized protein n=1 Tax=Forsythia ovata TaxID=205694 RepID=A0ABD1TQP0_9LAMI